jgi:hypothetical protein
MPQRVTLRLIPIAVMSAGNLADQDALKIIDTSDTKTLFDRLATGFPGSVVPLYPRVLLLPLVDSSVAPGLYESWASSVLASVRLAVSNPSVKRPKTLARVSRASSRRPCSPSSRPRLAAARSSQACARC